jgi:ribosomal protein L1
VQASARAKFSESVDLALKLGTDPRRGDQAVRGAVTLPYGTGRSIRIAVFAQGEAAEAARSAGATWRGAHLADRAFAGYQRPKHLQDICFDLLCQSSQRCVVALPYALCLHIGICIFFPICGRDRQTCHAMLLPLGLTTRGADVAGADVVGAEDLISKIGSQGSSAIDFDQCIATPDLMPKLGKIARILGPRGLMPNPKLGTLVDDVAGGVQTLRKGRVEFRCACPGRECVERSCFLRPERRLPRPVSPARCAACLRTLALITAALGAAGTSVVSVRLLPCDGVGAARCRADKGSVVHAGVGKVSFPTEHLLANIGAFAAAVLNARPKGVKGSGASGYVLTANVSSTMGPGIPVAVASIAQAAQAAKKQ